MLIAEAWSKFILRERDKKFLVYDYRVPVPAAPV